MSTAIFIAAMQSETKWRWMQASSLTTALRYVLSGLLLSAFSARAEAPVPSQEFWNYFVEFGDAQGEVFDPSDYAAVANLPARAKQEIDNASSAKRSEKVPSSLPSAQEQSK